MEPMLIIAIIAVIFFVLLRRIYKKIKDLTEYKNRTHKVINCLSQPKSMIVNSGSSKKIDINSLTCIQGARYNEIVDKYTLGRKAYPLQRCLEDEVNFRLMANAYGESVCLSTQESNEIVNDVAISSLAKDCLVDDNGLPDTTKSFIVDNDGVVGCISTMDLVNNYMNNMNVSNTTPSFTTAPVVTSTPTGTPF